MSNVIRQGTTPLVTIEVEGLDVSDADEWPTVHLAIKAQGSGEPVVVSRDELSLASTDYGCDVAYRLTQAQTLALPAHVPVLAQVRAKDKDGRAYATEVVGIASDVVIEDGEI